MSGVLLRQIRRRSSTIVRNARFSSTTAQTCSSHSFKFNSFHLHFRHHHHHRNPLIVFRNCGGAGAEILSSRDIHSGGEIPAIVNCPRCSAQIHLVFSNRRDPTLGYQAINLCRNCNSIYYFRPHKLLPLLQGIFLEIGRLKGNHGFVVQETSEFLHDRGDVIRSKARGGDVGGSGIGGCNNNSSSSGGSSSEEKDDWDGSGKDLPTPKEIRQALDKHVIGQEQAKKVLSVAVYNHYKRIFHAPSRNRATHFGDICIENDENDSVELEKSNVLLIGPTGSGKTLLAKTLAHVVNVPFVTADATTLTQAGYVGEDVESILYKLVKAADFNVEAAQQGIIYIDEIDKIIKKAGCSNINRDVSGEGVQQALLKMLEGTIVSVPDNETQKYSCADNIQIDTKDILFICGGAFVDLEKTISERRQDSSMGFGAPVRTNMRTGGLTNAILTSSLLESVESGDLVAYGLIPEFVGRFPILVCLSALNEAQLVRVLKDPKDALGKQYKKMFGMNGVKLHFTDEALRLIAKKAVAKNTGARGLRAILENILIEAMYEIPDVKTGEDRIDAVVVDKEAVGSVDAQGCGAKILRGNGAWKRYISKTTSVDSVVCSM